MRPRPLVTLALAVHNGERYLAEALDCLVGQSWREVEILIGDNASTDGTRGIALRYAERDSRIRYLRSDRNRGAAWNFNRLVGHARGRYFRWAAADDLVGAECVERTVEVLEARPDVVLAYPGTLLVDHQGRTIEEYDDNLHVIHDRPSERFLEVLRRLGLCNAFYGTIRLDALRRTGLLRSCPAPDTVLLPELALQGKFVEVPGRLFLRRFHEEAASAKEGDALSEHYQGRTEAEEEGVPGAGAPQRPPLYLNRVGRIGPMLSAVMGSPVPAREKARAAAGYLRGVIRARDDVATELVEAAGYRWQVARYHRARSRESTAGPTAAAGSTPERGPEGRLTEGRGGEVGQAADS